MNSAIPPKHARRISWLWIVIGVVFGLLVADQLYRAMLHHQVQGELSALRASGYPASERELEAWLKVLPDTENAALRVVQAGNDLSLPRDAFEHINWGRGEELGPQERQELQNLVTNNASALAMVHEAAHLTESRYPIEFQRGPEALLPHLAKIKSLTQLLKAESTLRLEEGRPDLAVQSVVDSIQLARTLDTEPLFISQLVRIACLSISCSALERVLTFHALTDPQLEQLSNAIRGADEASQSAFERGFVGETCLGIYCFSVPPAQMERLFDSDGSVGGMSPVGQVALPLYAWSGLRDRDFRFYLGMMRAMLDAAKSPYPECLSRSRATAEHLEQSLQKDKLLIASRLLLPALQKANEKAAESEGRLRSAQVALAIERFRIKNGGRSPENLGQLVPVWMPEVPRDPIDNASLRYQKRDVGYVVYSVGVNGEDNGGTERSASAPSGVRRWPSGSPETSSTKRHSSKTTPDYDVTFTVER